MSGTTQRILETIEAEVNRLIEVAADTSNELTYRHTSGIIVGMRMAKTIVERLTAAQEATE